MPSKSVTFTDEQYAHIVNTQSEGQSFSERVRDILDKGIAEETDE